MFKAQQTSVVGITTVSQHH